MSEERIGVLGATSIVGECLLKHLQADICQVTAFSRRHIQHDLPGIDWYRADHLPEACRMSTWINLAPIWVLQDYFPLIEQSGARRVIALSSTSRFTKADSSDTREQETAKRLAEAEEAFIAWAQDKGLDWVILRSTLIYGLGRDRNLSELARIIKRFRFFPLLGKALGRRQPVHADDVALACTAALEHPSPLGRSYELSGGEVLTYRQMIERIFLALGMKPRFVTIPLPLFCLAVRMLRLMPRYRGWSGAMAERMNRDLVFDHSEAERDLGFRPRGFELRSEDIPLD